MGDYPTDLLGWADEMDRSADSCREAGFPQAVEEGNRLLANLLRQAAAENAALRERVAVLERSIRWALGEVDMDGWFPLQGPNDPRYWWRSGLRSRAALAAAKPAAQEGKEAADG